MTIGKTLEGSTLPPRLTGRPDTTTAPQPEEVLKGSLSGVTELVLDRTDLERLSSTGPRAILFGQKQMNELGHMVVRRPNETILEVFDVTGSSDLLDIRA